MTWAAVGMTALGAVQGDKNERKAIQDMEYKAELMKYAPYSTVAANIAGQAGPGGPDQMQSMLAGASSGMQMRGGFADKTTPEAPVAPQSVPQGTNAANYTPETVQYANTLGGVDASNQIGQMMPNMTPEEMAKFKRYSMAKNGM